MRTEVPTESGLVGTGPEAEDRLPPGAKAGPWVVGEELGHGGMGSVYAVTHDEIGKRAALKVVHRRLCDGTTASRILLEARVVNRVAHPNVIDIFDTGTLDDGRPFIVMERLDGASLGRRGLRARLEPDAVIEILLQLCDGLAAAHGAGVVHRDLKLDNVFLLDDATATRPASVKILDWGIAKEVASDARFTIEGLLVGTPHYLSPEQARGDEVTPATDVYSLGVMAYELFLAQLPFVAETSAEVVTMHLRAAPPPPSELWPESRSSSSGCSRRCSRSDRAHARRSARSRTRSRRCARNPDGPGPRRPRRHATRSRRRPRSRRTQAGDTARTAGSSCSVRPR